MKRILAVLMITLGIGSVFANVTASEKEATINEKGVVLE